MVRLDKKARSKYMLSTRDTFKLKDTNVLKVKGWKSMQTSNYIRKQVWLY